jgi:hypothetical protein
MSSIHNHSAAIWPANPPHAAMVSVSGFYEKNACEIFHNLAACTPSGNLKHITR